MKLDDVDWHTGDQPNEVQAGVHIALVYCWLAERDYVQVTADRWHDWPKLLTDRRITPGEFFLQYADGQLVTDDITDKRVHDFLESWYQKSYLPEVGLDKLVKLSRDSEFEFPYNIANTWENVDKASATFDELIKSSSH